MPPRMEKLAALATPENIAAAKAFATALATPANTITALIAMNFAAFAAFGIDKARAERRAWRISESTLLLLALLGGTGGTYAGRALFRHKTRKEPFSSQLHQIAGLQFCAVVFLVVYFW